MPHRRNNCANASTKASALHVSDGIIFFAVVLDATLFHILQVQASPHRSGVMWLKKQLFTTPTSTHRDTSTNTLRRAVEYETRRVPDALAVIYNSRDLATNTIMVISVVQTAHAQMLIYDNRQ